MADLVASGTSCGRILVASRRILMRYCVIFVRRCLFLCIRNFGQYCKCSSICSRAWAYCLLSLHGTAFVSGRPKPRKLAKERTLTVHLIFCQSLVGEWALSIVLMYRYILPFSSLIVAYRLFASGQELRLQRPLTLYSFRQKFCVLVLTLYVQWPLLITCGQTI